MTEKFGINYLTKELELMLISNICQVWMHLLQAVIHQYGWTRSGREKSPKLLSLNRYKNPTQAKIFKPPWNSYDCWNQCSWRNQLLLNQKRMRGRSASGSDGGQESRTLDGRKAQPAGSHVWHSSFEVAVAFLSLMWNGFASNMEPKPEHPGGRQLHGSGSFLSGLCSRWMRLVASVMCLCQTVRFASLPTIFQLCWKGQSGGKDLAPHLGSWYMLIIAWLTKLRLWEKHQMFVHPEIKLHHLAVLLLASSVLGGIDTPRLLLLQFNVFKMTSPIQSQIWTSQLEHPPVPCHAMPREVGMEPAAVPWKAGWGQSQHTEQSAGENQPHGCLCSLWYPPCKMESTLLFRHQQFWMLRFKNLSQKEPMEGADCQHAECPPVGTSRCRAAWGSKSNALCSRPWLCTLGLWNSLASKNSALSGAG